MVKAYTAVISDSVAELSIDKYGVTLTTSLVKGNSVSVPMNAALAEVTIHVLSEYLEGLKSIKEGKE